MAMTTNPTSIMRRTKKGDLVISGCGASVAVTVATDGEADIVSDTALSRLAAAEDTLMGDAALIDDDALADDDMLMDDMGMVDVMPDVISAEVLVGVDVVGVADGAFEAAESVEMTIGAIDTPAAGCDESTASWWTGGG